MKKKKRGAGGRCSIRRRKQLLFAGWMILVMVLTSLPASTAGMGAERSFPGGLAGIAEAAETGRNGADPGRSAAAPGKGAESAAGEAEDETSKSRTDRPESTGTADQAGPGQAASGTGVTAEASGSENENDADAGGSGSGHSAGEAEAQQVEDPREGKTAEEAAGTAESGQEEQAGPDAPGTEAAASEAPGTDPSASDPVGEADGKEAGKSGGRDAAETDAAGQRQDVEGPAESPAAEKTGRDAEKGEGDAAPSGSADPAASGSSAASGTTQAKPAAEGAGTKEADTTETPSGSAAEDRVSADSAAEAAQEEIWMTEAEFNRAYESVTTGAANAGASSLSNARIVSKESEIDYEELGIGTHVSGHPGHTTPINVRDGDGNEYTGVCVVPDDRGWAKGTVLPNVTRVTDAVMIRLYYYTMLDSYGEDLAKSRGFGSDSKKVAIAACHEAMSMRYAELAGITYDRPNVNSNLRSLISAYRSGVSSKATPDSNKVFVYISARTQSGGHWMQAYVFGRIEEDEPASIVLKKVSSDPDMRNAYSAWYCLHETASGGTVDFRMYTDRACTKKAVVYTDANMTKELDPIPVGLSGKSGLWNQSVFYCPPGTYYLKELTTPRGYRPHSEPFGPYTLQEGKGKTIKVENEPDYAQIGVIKKGSDTGKGLAGAKFGLYADIEDARNEAEPMGIFTTGSDGKSNRLEVLAGKTYYVREIEAPAGYKLMSGVRAMKPAESLTETAWTELSDEPDNGTVQVKKSSADPDVDLSAAGSPYSLAGAQYTLYDANGDKAGTLTTKDDGVSNVLTVPSGKYTLKETKASPGFALDITTYKVTVESGSLSTVESAEPPVKGSVQVLKRSSDASVDLGDGSPYSLAGAEYSLCDAAGRSAGTLKTREDGASNVLTVLCGTYTVKETKASPGFELDPETYTVTVTPDGAAVTVESVEPVRKAGIVLHKYSSEEKEGKEADTAPVKGAVYGIYASREDAQEERGAAGTFVVGEDGTSNEVRVFAGRTWYVKETKTPAGYLPDETIHEVTPGSLTEIARVESEEQLIFGGVKVCKLDLETGKNTPLGGASLEGTVLRIYNDGEMSVYAEGRKVLPGAQALTLTTDAEGFAQTSQRALSYGQYRLEEVTAPEGYTTEGAKAVRFSIEEDGTVVDLTKAAQTSVQDRVIRGDFSIRKINSYTQKRMAGVTFEITALDPEGKALEKHRFTTDENGVFESTAAFAAKLRAQKDAEKSADQKAGAAADGGAGQEAGETADGSPDPETAPGAEDHAGGEAAETTEAEDGRIWFGIGTKPSDALGALPFGDYHIEEIEGENNRGMKMFSDDFSIYADGQVLALGNIENTLRPVLETELVDENGSHFADQRGIVTLTDTVTYAGMEDYIGKDVTFHGVIYVKETGKPLVIDGRTVECVKTKRILSHTSTVQLRFTFDASKAQGMTLVCFEYASEAVTGSKDADGEPGNGADGAGSGSTGEDSGEDPGEEPPGPAGEPGTGDGFSDSTNGGTDIVSHTDLEDESQTVRLVRIETDARDQLTGMHVGEAREGAVTVDHVTCRGLTPGQDYLVTGALVDKSTGRPLKAADGSRITAKASFRADAATEVVDLTFTYDASLLEGTTVVAFEYLYLDGQKSPDTPGGDGQGGDTPDTPGGHEPGEDDPDPDDHGPGDRPIAVHEDPDDEDQSVHYPQIRTHASAEDGVSRTLTAQDSLTIHDRVTWKNLVPGRRYRLQGALMRKDSGEPLTVGGKAVTASASFTAKTADGETVLAFTADADALKASMDTETLAVVAFEELYISAEVPEKDETDPPGTREDDPEGQTDPQEGAESGEDPDAGHSGGGSNAEADAEEYLIASHKDLEDPAQTVFVQKPMEPEKPETPENPQKPDKPAGPGESEEPESPGTPKTPSEPEKTPAKKSKTSPSSPETIREAKSARTGDETEIALYLIPALLAAAGLAALAAARFHRARKKP